MNQCLGCTGVCQRRPDMEMTKFRQTLCASGPAGMAKLDKMFNVVSYSVGGKRTVTAAQPKRRRGCGCNKRRDKLDAAFPSLKLGSKIEAVAKVTGIKSVVERVFGKETEMRWAYGVTTVPERLNDLLPQTLESLRDAGFDQPRLFVDGAKDPSAYEQFGLNITTRYPNIRTAGNWVLSLYELYYRDPQADRFAIFQDDFVTCKNLREYLERIDYPYQGYCNLYTFPVNQARAPHGKYGWFESDQLGKGAVALVLSNEAVRILLSARHLVERPTDPHRGWRAIDGGIVDSFKKAGWKEFCHNPSLVQHIGDVSSMRNKRHPRATTFPGNTFDALDLIK